MRYDGDTLKIREKTLHLIYTEEADFYFDRAGGEEYWEDYELTEEDAQEWRDFNNEFVVLRTDALASEDFYQGMDYMFVVKRKRDNNLFGMTYYHGGGKYGESHFTEESDGEEYSLDPVRLHYIETYEFEKLK